MVAGSAVKYIMGPGAQLTHLQAKIEGAKVDILGSLQVSSGVFLRCSHIQHSHFGSASKWVAIAISTGWITGGAAFAPRPAGPVAGTTST